MRHLRAIIACGIMAAAFTATPSFAEKIIYYQDPVFEKLNAQDPHPMDELLTMADEGDVRAQYILADLYSKGKGGLVKSEKKGQFWFEKAAEQGYYASFIRLAALAKHRSNWVEAYQWYTLAMQSFPSGKDQKYATKARNELAEEKELSRDDINAANKAVNDWKRAAIADQRDRAEKEKLEKRKAEMRARENEDIAKRERENMKLPKTTSMTKSMETKPKEIRTND